VGACGVPRTTTHWWLAMKLQNGSGLVRLLTCIYLHCIFLDQNNYCQCADQFHLKIKKDIWNVICLVLLAYNQTTHQVWHPITSLLLQYCCVVVLKPYWYLISTYSNKSKHVSQEEYYHCKTTVSVCIILQTMVYVGRDDYFRSQTMTIRKSYSRRLPK